MGTKRGVQVELALARLRISSAGACAPGDSRPRSATSTTRATRCSASGARERGAHRPRRRAEGRRHRRADPAGHRALSVGGAPRHADAAAGRRRRSRKARAPSSSRTRARRPRSGIRRFSPRAPIGRDASRCITARSTGRRATGSRTGCAPARCAASSRRRRSTSASTSRRSIACCRSAARRASRGCCSARDAAGTGPARSSRVTCVPTNALELIEVAAARDGVGAGAIESRLPVERPLDVLAQHVVTVALGGGFDAERAACARCARRARTPSSTDDEWEWVLDFVDVRRRRAARVSRVRAHRARGRPLRRRRTTRSRAGIACRSARSSATRRSACSTCAAASLGTVEESFVARLKPGDRFVFAGTPLEFVRVRDMKAWVRRAPNAQGRDSALGGEPAAAVAASSRQLLRARLGEAADGVVSRRRRWRRCGRCSRCSGSGRAFPRADELLIERVKTREGWHLFVYPFEGRLVHEGLAALFAYRLSRVTRRSRSRWRRTTTGSSCCRRPSRRSRRRSTAGLLSARSDLLDDIQAALNATEMAQAAVPRDRARRRARVSRASRARGRRRGSSRRRADCSSTCFQRYDPGNLLLVAGASREVLERQLESTRLGATLQRLSRSTVVVTAAEAVDAARVSAARRPHARAACRRESLADRIRRMQLALERAAGMSGVDATRSSTSPASAGAAARARGVLGARAHAARRRPALRQGGGVPRARACRCRAARRRRSLARLDAALARTQRDAHRLPRRLSPRARGARRRDARVRRRVAERATRRSTCCSCAATTTRAPAIPARSSTSRCVDGPVDRAAVRVHPPAGAVRRRLRALRARASRRAPVGPGREQRAAAVLLVRRARRRCCPRSASSPGSATSRPSPAIAST